MRKIKGVCGGKGEAELGKLSNARLCFDRKKGGQDRHGAFLLNCYCMDSYRGRQLEHEKYTWAESGGDSTGGAKTSGVNDSGMSGSVLGCTLPWTRYKKCENEYICVCVCVGVRGCACVCVCGIGAI